MIGIIVARCLCQVMSQEQIGTLVDEIFEKYDEEEGAAGLSYKDFMDAVTQHPILVSFVKGEGPVRYGQSK